ncbi:MAG: hypothetical protein M1274_04670 [Actinobacteria bacterium]|nr:hypothetical protein [Actinomycetota bacterium]
MSSARGIHHPELAAGRWLTLSLLEQLANTGSEVERALKWAEKGNPEYCTLAIERALELLDLTIADPKNRHRLKEITRLREVLLDYFFGPNEFGSSPASWHSYFQAYGMGVALRRRAASA